MAEGIELRLRLLFVGVEEDDEDDERVLLFCSVDSANLIVVVVVDSAIEEVGEADRGN